MRLRLTLAGALVLLLLAICPSASSHETDKPAVRQLAFVHVNVIPMTQDTVIKDQTVIIERGKIKHIGPATSVRIPLKAQQIDGRGKYLMPGLVDFHVHLRDPSELLSYLAHGVTTVVQMSGRSGNVPDVLALRRRIAAGEVLGPSVYYTGRILDGNPAINPGVSTVVSTPDEARRAVEDQYHAGVNFIKVYNNLTPAVLRAIVGAAHQRGLAVIGHIPRRDGRSEALQTALNAGPDKTKALPLCHSR